MPCTLQKIRKNHSIHVGLIHSIQILLKSTCILDHSNSEPLILDVRKEAQECIECYAAQQNNRIAPSNGNVAEKVLSNNGGRKSSDSGGGGESEKAFEGGQN